MVSPALAVLASILVCSTAFAATKLVLCSAFWAMVESESTKAALAMRKYFAILITKTPVTQGWTD
jgi:hypothetical protein